MFLTKQIKNNIENLITTDAEKMNGLFDFLPCKYVELGYEKNSDYNIFDLFVSDCCIR